MRKLCTADLFRAARAVTGSGLRDNLKQVMLNADKQNIESVGVDTILAVMECFSEKGAERAVYEVLAGPFEMTPEQVESLELSELLDCIDALVKDPGASGFFRRLSDLIGSN